MSTPPMPPDAAADLLKRYAAHKDKLTVAAAEAMLRAFLQRSHPADRYGNHLDGPNSRWHFDKQTLRRQVKEEGEWRSRRSEPMVEAAAALLADAARVAGDERAAKRAAAELTSRTAAADKRAKAARDDERKTEASRAGIKAFSAEFPDALARASGYGPPIPAGDVPALQERLQALRDGFLADLREGRPLPPDGRFASIDRPPTAPLVRPVKYAWVEEVGGVRYTIKVEPANDGTANVEIGRAGGAVSVNATTMAPRFSRDVMVGDAYLSGTVALAKSGTVSGSLLLLVSHSATGGLRVGSIWCRMMSGWGADRWVGLGLNEQALRFVSLLERRGSIEVTDRRGGSLVMRCLGRRDNPARSVKITSTRSRKDRGRDERRYVVARDGREEVGRATWWMGDAHRHGVPPTAHLHMLYVAPKSRRGGLALEILERVKEDAIEAGAERLTTDVVWKGSLVVVDRVFGPDSREYIGDAVREYDFDRALALLPARSPEVDGHIDADVHLDVAYDLTGRVARDRLGGDVAAANEADVRDALRHANSYYDLPESPSRYDRRLVASMPLDEIGTYDDPSAWLEIERGSLAAHDDDALREALSDYRGREWADMAMSWRRNGAWRIPPVVVVESKSAATIGDGRGRFNLAEGLGLASLPVELLTLREARGRAARGA